MQDLPFPCRIQLYIVDILCKKVTGSDTFAIGGKYVRKTFY